MVIILIILENFKVEDYNVYLKQIFFLEIVIDCILIIEIDYSYIDFIIGEFLYDTFLEFSVCYDYLNFGKFQREFINIDYFYGFYSGKRLFVLVEEGFDGRVYRKK